MSSIVFIKEHRGRQPGPKPVSVPKLEADELVKAGVAVRWNGGVMDAPKPTEADELRTKLAAKDAELDAMKAALDAARAELEALKKPSDGGKKK